MMIGALCRCIFIPHISSKSPPSPASANFRSPARSTVPRSRGGEMRVECWARKAAASWVEPSVLDQDLPSLLLLGVSLFPSWPLPRHRYRNPPLGNGISPPQSSEIFVIYQVKSRSHHFPLFFPLSFDPKNHPSIAESPIRVHCSSRQADRRSGPAPFQREFPTFSPLICWCFNFIFPTSQTRSGHCFQLMNESVKNP